MNTAFNSSQPQMKKSPKEHNKNIWKCADAAPRAENKTQNPWGSSVRSPFFPVTAWVSSGGFLLTPKRTGAEKRRKLVIISGLATPSGIGSIRKFQSFLPESRDRRLGQSYSFRLHLNPWNWMPSEVKLSPDTRGYKRMDDQCSTSESSQPEPSSQS